MTDYKTELIEKYSKISKHSNYQILPDELNEAIGGKNLVTKSRHEAERLNYVLGKLQLKNKTLLDIGSNTGYFAIEAIKHGAKQVVCYEGNTSHAEFISAAAKLLECQDKISVHPEYYKFNSKRRDVYDIILLFNVLHHYGDDYGSADNYKDAKKIMLEQLNSLAWGAKNMAFQLGFNWQGNPNSPLFRNGTKNELVEFIQKGSKNFWDVVAIGIADKDGSTVVYNDINENNIDRNDSLGEFLNRPIFILKSKKIK